MNPDLQILENVPLAPLTTLGVGGSARYFVRAEGESDVAGAIEFALDRDIPLFVLGGGSNVLIADAGFNGLVLHIAITGKRVLSSEADISQVEVAAGEDWDAFVEWSVEHDLAGIECLSGIPGFVGGTPVQNVGAYGQEVSETILSVRCFDRVGNCFVTLSNRDCDFSYRKSVFNSTQSGRYVVVSVVFALLKCGEPRISYRDLVEHFAGRTPTLAEARNAVIAIRRMKAMVIDKNDPDSKSAGSFFKNPVVSRAKFDAIAAEHSGVRSFAFGDDVKIPAAWLIENSGFHKGYALGNAGISSKHTLALINRDHASADELIVLKDKIRAAVAAKFGIDLTPEPVFIGFNKK